MFASHFSLFKKSCYWYIQFVDVDGRRKQKSTRCKYKPDALHVLVEFKKLLETKPLPKTYTQFTSEFSLFAQSNYSKGTATIYRYTLAHFKHVVNDCTLTSITEQHIDRYKTERLKRVAPVTLNIELRTLRSAFNVALRWKLITRNPFSKVQLVRIPEMLPTYFTKNDFQKLTSIVRESWLKELIIFAVSTGMRRGELVNLKWSDVDLNKRILFIQSSPTFKTKQGKRRTIPISDVAFHVLQLKLHRSKCENVFSISDRQISLSFVSHKFKEYVKEAMLPDKLHFHSLRHSFASWLAQSNVSIYTLKELLGHSDVKTTQIYSHLVSNEMHNVVNKIDVNLN